MDLLHQAQAERETLRQALQAMVQGRHIGGDFHHIVQRDARSLVVLESQQVGQRGLGVFDLRRQYGLFAHIGVDEKSRVRQQGSHPIQAPERQRSLLLQAKQARRLFDGRRGGQGVRHEGLHRLASGGSNDVNPRA